MRRMMSFIRNHIFVCLVAAAMIFFTAVVVSSLLHPTHFLKNLEPYPDGLLYSLSARNLSDGKGMQLLYRDTGIAQWVPPLYTVVLAIVYVISDAPSGFVAINTLLGLSSLYVLALIVWKTTRSTAATALALTLYLSHAYVIWLPTLAMSENIALLLTLIGIAGVTIWKNSRTLSVATVGVAAIGLLLTRYAAVPIAAMLVLLLVMQYRKVVRVSHVIVGVILLVITLLGFGVVVPSAYTMVGDFFVKFASGSSQFYSLQFVVQNKIGYMLALIGKPSPFLWQTVPLTSIFASFTLVVLPFLAWKLKKFRSETVVLLALFAAQFPLMLIFYTLDTRYIIYSLPIIAIAGGLTYLLASKVLAPKVLIPVVAILLLLHLSTQASLFKEILSANVLGRTVAWQHAAIKHFDSTLADADDTTFVITALPPFLVDAYTTAHYRVLPLSPSQEFIAKGEWVWGSDTKPVKDFSDFTMEHLFAEIDELLLAGNPVFISNAYITHLHEVTQDYELFKARYTLEPVSEGCQNACDLYRVR